MRGSAEDGSKWSLSSAGPMDELPDRVEREWEAIVERLDCTALRDLLRDRNRRLVGAASIPDI